MKPFFLILLPLIFAAFWSGVVSLISLVSGWHRLAGSYRCSHPLQVKLNSFQSLRMRPLIHYSGIISTGPGDGGFYLKVMGVFRPGHPVLFIPYDHCRVEKRQGFFYGGYRIHLRDCPSVPLDISENYFRSLGMPLPEIPRT